MLHFLLRPLTRNEYEYEYECGSECEYSCECELVRQMKLASGHPHSHLNMHEEVPPRQGAYHLAKGLQPVGVQITPSRRRGTRHFTPSTNVSSYLSCGAGFFLILFTFNENQIRFVLTLTTCIQICLGNQNKKRYVPNGSSFPYAFKWSKIEM